MIMQSKMLRYAGLVLIFMFTMNATGSSDQKDKDAQAQLKIALDDLKAEVIVLERQVRSMQESMDRNSGQMNTLITQIVDNVNAIRQAQSRVAEGATSAITEVNGLGERLTATNQRIDK